VFVRDPYYLYKQSKVIKMCTRTEIIQVLILSACCLNLFVNNFVHLF